MKKSNKLKKGQNKKYKAKTIHFTTRLNFGEGKGYYQNSMLI